MNNLLKIGMAGLMIGMSYYGDELDTTVDGLCDHAVATYNSPRTGLFYGRAVEKVAPLSKYLSIEDYKQGKYRTQPYKAGDEDTVGYNLHGGGTGTEDCSLFTGTMLAAACDRYLATGEKERSEKLARLAFRGLCSAALAHGEPGFIARGVSPEDGKSIFAGSSRDQFTNCIYGLWRYAHSDLATAEDKEVVKKIVVGVAEKMIREVTPERNYSFSFAYGVPDDRGVALMYSPEKRTLALRLCMFYGAAFDMTGDEKYYKLMMSYIDGSLDGMQNWGNAVKKNPWGAPPYVVLQQAYALQLLHAVVREQVVRERIVNICHEVAEFVISWERYDLKKVNARDLGEIINGLLQMPGAWKMTPMVEGYLRKKVKTLGTKGWGYPGSDYNLIAAWWAWRARKVD